MKFSENDVTITRIEFEPGDTAMELLENVECVVSTATVSVVDGALEFRA